MDQIRELIESHNEYVTMILFSVLAMMVVVFAVHYFTEKIRFPKYLPGLIVLISGILMFIRYLPKLTDKAFIDDIVMACLLIGLGIIGLCFALILGVIFKVKKNPKKDQIIYDEY
ncbi:MAG: hypothetical protein Q4E36_02005 [Bacillota bacterium]|nr:hypothetical protein [Bacillota bacterium]